MAKPLNKNTAVNALLRGETTGAQTIGSPVGVAEIDLSGARTQDRGPIGNLTAGDIAPGINRTLDYMFGSWVWEPATDKARDAFERWDREAMDRTSAALGYSFGDTDSDADNTRRSAWIDHWSAQPDIHDALNERFGDPMALFGRVPGLHDRDSSGYEARQRWTAMRTRERAA